MYIVFFKDRISPEQVIKVKFLPQEKLEIHLFKLCEWIFSIKWIAKLSIQYPIEPNSDSIWALQLAYLNSYFPVHTLLWNLKRVI